MTLPLIALVLAVILAAPAVVVASVRIWPSGSEWGWARALDALWTVVPGLMLALLLVLAAGAGL